MPVDISSPRSTRELTTTHTVNRRTGGMAFLFNKPKLSNYHQAATPGLNSTPLPYEGCHAPGKPCFKWTVTDWCEQLQRSETHAHSTISHIPCIAQWSPVALPPAANALSSVRCRALLSRPALLHRSHSRRCLHLQAQSFLARSTCTCRSCPTPTRRSQHIQERLLPMEVQITGDVRQLIV
ncbi:hypothetical protein P389DRAFT_49220 [Cystobasidium minutum MCA 4210]|uniref:uncharacterized protein n=1 Tax=Cystobasidium minutum MCA 4210 TaxID=1397322 RepID=UPI0034CFF91F|eukprot:jgi/Rhomi1/49220/CE49219_286